MRKTIVTLLLLAPALLAAEETEQPSYPLVDTGQDRCYDATKTIPFPAVGAAFDGQDAQYLGRTPAYRDNGDGTVTDLVTGLTWSQGVDLEKRSLKEALKAAEEMTLAGHEDWRVPTIKELYSLMDFRGCTGFPERRQMGAVPDDAVPFLDTDVFGFAYGNTAADERYIDAQWLSRTRYVATTMGGNATLFGVNFADGRIKGYPDGPVRRGHEKKFYVRYVRGPAYGINDFHDNGDGTVTDRATGLTWMQADSGKAMNWQAALEYAENLELAGHTDWRLPDAKELQSIVDYTRSPDTTQSAAIDPVFRASAIVNEAGVKDWPCYWSSTTHLDGPRPGNMAVYVAFGRALGQMHERIMDVHGAGAQRSDPKEGEAVMGHGPQGDARRVMNHVRCVRGGGVLRRDRAPERVADRYPDKRTIIGIPGGGTDGAGPGDDRAPREGGGREDGGRDGGRRPPGREGGGPDGGRDGPPDGRSFVRRLDKDGDGAVSREEFDGPPDAFDRHDTNGDGKLSADEAPPPPRR